MTTALVPAAPERKRILRELLARPEPWPVAHRNVYRQMIEAEYFDVARSTGDDLMREAVEKDLFAACLLEGIPASRAIHIAQENARLPLQTQTEGQRERERRRTFREAVTANDGALAVTTGLVTRCVTCGGSLSAKRRRTDSAYCSDACRQAAYRRRRR
jgi:hypothetical protein